MKLRYIIMNVANIIEKQVLDLYKTTAYQKLNAYYGQSTLFNVLGIERSENRHSAFLQWLLNPKSSHGKGLCRTVCAGGYARHYQWGCLIHQTTNCKENKPLMD